MKRTRSILYSAFAVLAMAATGVVGAGTADAAPPDHARSGGSAEPTTTTVTWGPFNVPAATASGPGMISNAMVREGGCRVLPCVDLAVEKPCEDCYITGIVPDLVDPDTGETINYDNGGMLHHVVNVNWSAPDVTCPPGEGGIIGALGSLVGGNDRFFASGNERTLFEAPRNHGLYVSADDDWGLIIELMNMTPSPRDMVLEYTFTWVPDTPRMKPLTPVWLDIDNCADSEVHLGDGYSDTEWDWTSTIDGQIMSLAGHVHDGGISLSAENVTRNKVICTSLAGYEHGSVHAPDPGSGSGTDALHPEDPWSMTASDHPTADLDSYEGHLAGATGCMPRQRIRPGDTVRLHAQYDLAHMDHGGMGHGQMGIMVAYMRELG